MKAWSFLFAFFLCAVSARPSCALGTSLVLRFGAVVDSTFVCAGHIDEVLVFRDGLVVSTVIKDDGKTLVSRAIAPAAALVRLASALADNRVDLARGNCSVGLFVPNESRRFTIDWLGRFGRNNSFAVSDVEGEACPASTRAIVAGIQEFIGSALGSPESTLAVLPGEPKPPCEP